MQMNSNELTHVPAVSLLGMCTNERLQTCVLDFALRGESPADSNSAAELVGETQLLAPACYVLPLRHVALTLHKKAVGAAVMIKLNKIRSSDPIRV